MWRILRLPIALGRAIHEKQLAVRLQSRRLVSSDCIRRFSLQDRIAMDLVIKLVGVAGNLFRGELMAARPFAFGFNQSAERQLRETQRLGSSRTRVLQIKVGGRRNLDRVIEDHQRIRIGPCRNVSTDLYLRDCLAKIR